MNCHDARDLLSGLVDGALTPDEQSRVEAHLADCADCRKEHERFSATITLLRQMERPRAPIGFVDRVLAAAQPAPWHRRLLGRLFLPLSVKLPAEAAALLLVAGLAVFVFQRTPELQQAARQAPASQAVREHVPLVAPAPVPPVPTPPRTRVALPPRAPVAASPAPSANVLLSAPARSRDEGSAAQGKATTPAVQEQQNLARDERAPEPAAKVTPPAPEASPPTSQLTDELKAGALKKETAIARKSVESAAARRAEPVAPQPLPAPAVERRDDAPREKAAQAPAATPAPPRSAMRVLPSADVTGRLAVKDLDAAQQALTSLLARSGGVVSSRREDAGTIVMEVAIPKAAYADFNEGLTRIGAWQSEGKPSESATSVRVTLRLVP